VREDAVVSAVIFAITAACIDLMDRSCVAACPVDCIYEGGRSLYIHPEECIGCGACESVCPVEAIWRVDIVPDELAAFVADNRRFFVESGLGSPGGAAGVGPVDHDTALVAAQRARTEE
jgi:NAD-dependent dihydropyrimidine dehydrogenase PreA subunit